MKRLTFLFFFSQFFILGLFAEDIIVRTAQELIEIRERVNNPNHEESTDFSGSTIYLANDINLEDIGWIPIGTEGRPFRGTFDGKGHWIHNLTVKVEGGLHAGLFGVIGENGVVRQVGISSGTVGIISKPTLYPNSECYSGSIAGQNYGTISQCANLATIYGNQINVNVGGIVGMIASIENTEIYGVVEDCYNLGRLYTSKNYEQNNYLGGIAGNCDDCIISRVYVNASIEKGALSRVGGIVAVQTFDSDVSNAYYSEGNAYYNEYDELCGESMLGFALDGELNDPQGDYSIWSFADGRLPLLTCMLELLKGDVNMDGQVSIADVTALVNIILGKDNVPPYQYDHVAANVNKDEGVSIADVTALVNIILGKEEEVALP